jgi:hypothetical protein
MAATDVEIELERCYDALEWAADEIQAAELEMQSVAVQRDNALLALSSLHIKSNSTKNSLSKLCLKESTTFFSEMETMLTPIENLAQDLVGVLEVVQGSVQYVMEVSDQRHSRG